MSKFKNFLQTEKIVKQDEINEALKESKNLKKFKAELWDAMTDYLWSEFKISNNGKTINAKMHYIIDKTIDSIGNDIQPEKIGNN